jgi:peptide/nickel transport system substrate-binding protein
MRKFAGCVFGLLAVGLLTLGLAACGGGSDSGSSSSSGNAGGGKSGGSIKVGTVGPDSYDPALAQTVQAFQPLYKVYTGLLAFKDEYGKSGQDLTPGLAEKMPTISSDLKTYTFQLRKGLKYSDGTPVKPGDFEVAIKRLQKLAGPYSSFLAGIEGVDAFQKKGDPKGDISGITDTPDGKITVKLTEPDSKFQFAVAEPYAAPVPASKVKYSSMTKDPPPGYGPYTWKVVDPSREFILTRRKDFNIPGMAKGKIDKITGLVSSNITKMTQDVINGNLDFMTEDPTGDQLATVKQKYKDRYSANPYPSNTYYFSLNTSIPPFNKEKAREAVNYAVDSRALVRVFSGRLTPTCTFIPPGVIGYKKETCPYGDPNGPGNINKAKQLVKESGTAGQSVTVWTNNKDPRPAIGEYLRDTLNQMGYKAKTKTLNQQVYFDAIGTKSRKAQIHFNDWFMDFPDPSDLFQPLVTKEALASTPTFNVGFIDDPKVNSETARLTKEKTPAEHANDWAALDKYLVGPGKSYVVPYGSEEKSTFMSERMNYKDCNGVHQVFSNDWALFCLK